jgi:threonine/homoserine/homoserine lactone efflux protein
MKRPLVVLAIPLIIGALAWAGFAYLRATIAQVPLRPGETHSAAEHGLLQLYVLFVFIFVPFSALCFVASAVMLVRRARSSRFARWALVPVGLLLLGILILLGTIISYFV